MGGWPDPRAEMTEDQDRFTIDDRPTREASRKAAGGGGHDATVNDRRPPGHG